jgi:O-antigen/teichoic acid export membrane protein
MSSETVSKSRPAEGRMSTLLRHSVVYGLGSIASKLVSIVLLPLYTRYLSRADYGRVELSLTVVIVLSILVQLGLTNALFRFWFDSDDDAQRARIFRSVLLTVGVVASAALALVIVFASPIADAIFDHSTAVTRDLVRISAVGLWANALYDVLRAALRVQQRATTFVVVNLANLLLTTAGTIVFVAVFDLRARGLLLGNYIGTVAAVALLLVMLRSWLVARAAADSTPTTSTLKAMLAFGIPMVPAALALWAVNLANRPIIVAILGSSALGVYAIGAKLAQGILLLVSAFQMAWPAFAHSIKSDDDARRTYARTLSLYAAGMLWAVCVLQAVTPWAVRILVSHHRAFYPGMDAVLPLSLGASLYGAYFIASIGAARVKRTRFNWIIAAAAGGVEVGLLYLLTPDHGIVGAAWAVCAAYGTMVVLMLTYSQRCFYVPYEWRRIATVLVASAAVLASVAQLPGSGWANLTARIALGLSLPVILLALGFFTPTERARLRGRRSVID